MPSTTELMNTNLGKAFVEAKQKADRINMSYRKNEIGEDIVVEYNPYALSSQRDKNGRLKFPYAEAIAEAYDEMIEQIIPKDAILSASFQSWINREKNQLMLDSRINRDEYFKSQTDFETGEITENRGNNLLVAKMEFLEKMLIRVGKGFVTHMRNNADKAFADEETLKKYEAHYQGRLQEVNERLESGNFSYYDKKDKDGNIIKEGTQEDALRHKSNIDNLMYSVENAKKEREQTAQSFTEDFVGDNLSKLNKQRM